MMTKQYLIEFGVKNFRLPMRMRKKYFTNYLLKNWEMSRTIFVSLLTTDLVVKFSICQQVSVVINLNAPIRIIFQFICCETCAKEAIHLKVRRSIRSYSCRTCRGRAGLPCDRVRCRIRRFRKV